jgi:hypothetical protein
LEAKVQIKKTAVVISSVALLAMYGCTCTSDGLELDAPNHDRRSNNKCQFSSGRTIDADLSAEREEQAKADQ